MKRSGKILFLFYHALPHQGSSASKYAPNQLNLSLLDVCIRIYGKENVVVATYPFLRGVFPFSRLGNRTFKYIHFLLRQFENLTGIGLEKHYLNRWLNIHGITKVFLTNSISFSPVSRNLKKMPVECICFFHNYETIFLRESRFDSKIVGWRRFWRYWLRKKMIAQEKTSILCSDKLMLLSDRDASAILNDFPAYDLSKKIVISPAVIKDKFTSRDEEKEEKIENANSPLRLLFVGSDWLPNVEGIRWFLEKVLPFLKNVNVDVVGSVCMACSPMPLVSFWGMISQEDLENKYRVADAVIAPLHWGGGMKIKVAEALMYGKTVLGTDEAFAGYAIESQALILCKEAEDFIREIEALQKKPARQKMNLHARRIYQTYHSEEALRSRVEAILSA